ncbi:MAG: hypothetical protein H0T92_08020 [Pyrinomonadaceae bacterium]|nr:hypothetical protein [Pyrinomonadaceae bacterium]
MTTRIRVEISGRDAFWQKAVLVEWEHQFPTRELMLETDNSYLIEPEWLDDLQRVANQCFSKVIVAPKDPSRRLWFRRLLPRSDDE